MAEHDITRLIERAEEALTFQRRELTDRAHIVGELEDIVAFARRASQLMQVSVEVAKERIRAVRPDYEAH